VRDWLYPYYCGAGRGLREKYEETSKRWRRRVLKRLRLVLVPPAVVLFVAALVDHFNFASWLFGLALGALMAIYMTLRESPPPHIENWRTGLEGEQRTAKALAPLRRRGYVLLHDLPDRRDGELDHKRNIDHVVVSTAEVFLLDSKYLRGEVSIDGDTAHVQMLDDDEDSYSFELGRAMRGRAVRLQEDIEETGISGVQAVVVFWNPFPAGVAYGHRVAYLHGDRLAGWLQAQAPKIAPDMVSRVAAAIAQGRPRENQTWWERLPRLGFRRQRAAADSVRDPTA
jgi:hypothetical protein